MLVFDQAYGGRDRPELGDAFWLVDSPANRVLAERAWKASATDPNSAIFKRPPPASAQDVVEKVEEIDLHHPDWLEIVAVGVQPTAELTSALEAEGFAMVSASGSLSIRRRGR
jgi:hypothetical protein